MFYSESSEPISYPGSRLRFAKNKLWSRQIKKYNELIKMVEIPFAIDTQKYLCYTLSKFKKANKIKGFMRYSLDIVKG